jgi:endonuclease-3
MALKKREKAEEIAARLARAIPNPIVELDFQDAWQLLVATILSAQSTDKTVNQVTPALFAAYPTPRALADAPPEDVERIVKTTGFFRNKTKSIQAASRRVAEDHGGRVPETMEALVELPGVARKTANVVLGSAYRIAEGIVVDTHAGRVSRRLRLTKEEDPVKVEEALCALFPREKWIDTGHRFVLHGRYVCTSRAPLCASCPLNEHCPGREAKPAGSWEERADAERGRIPVRADPLRSDRSKARSLT